VPSPPKRAGNFAAASTRVEILRDRAFNHLPWLVHGFSTRPGGISRCYGGQSLNLGLTPHDTDANVQHNRALFLQALGAVKSDGSLWPLAQVKQIHSAIVYRLDGFPEHPTTGDGIITDRAGVVLAIKTADCVPVLVADVKQRVVGAFHAGWRGTLARMVEKGVGEMRRQFASQPRDLRAAIGPCIRRCCYTVGREVEAEFESQFGYSAELFEQVFDSRAIHIKYPLLFLNQCAPGHGDLGPEVHLDLVAANRRQLADAGVREQHISIVEGCTACDTKRFFSHRNEFGKTGRMLAAIAIRPQSSAQDAEGEAERSS
jgi:YfiH family protein